MTELEPVREPGALHLLGLQYELALLVGKGVVLEAMLREFFPAALRRLECRAAYVWLRDGPTLPLRLRYAYPRGERARVEPGGDLAAAPAEQDAPPARVGDAFVYKFSLGPFGHCLVVKDRQALANATQAALQPLMQRLGHACGACLEHERAQAALRLAAANEQKLRAVVLSMTDSLMVEDSGGQLVMANPAMDRLALAHGVVTLQPGMTMSDVWTFLPPGLRIGDDAPGPCLIELPDQALEAERIPVQFADEGADGYHGCIWRYRDVSAERRREQESQEALARERELSALKTKFVSMTSHEFRTPLAAIMSAVDLLDIYGERMSADENKGLLQSIKASVKRSASMMDNVLLAGRIDAGKLDFQPCMLPLTPFFESIVDEHRMTLTDGKELHARIESMPDAAADSRLLRHIAGNLIANALKYSRSGGVVDVVIERAGGDLCVDVRDDGIGIPAEDIPKLFGSFFRAANAGNIPGTGLGLAIVKRAVELHGGTIAVDSREGEGTRFTARLPLWLERESG